MTKQARYAYYFTLSVLLLAGGLLRFWHLGDKVFMHDESLFAYYSYCVHPLFNYRYEPILHGPLLLHLTAGLFAWIGDNDFTARFWPACFGTACIAIPFFLRRRISAVGVMATSTMICFSPTLLYYSRFLRNDIPLLFFLLLCLLSYMRWYAGKHSAIAGFLTILAVGIMVCIKENAVFFYFTALTFLLYLFMVDLISGLITTPAAWKSMRFRMDDIIRFIYIGIGNCLFWIVMVFVGRRLFIDPISQTSFTGIRHEVVSIAILIALAFSQIILWFLVEDWRSGLGRHRLGKIFVERIVRTSPALLAGFLIALSLYAALFTTWFKFKWGFFEIYRETLSYWWGQHQEHRLKGPFHYYMFRILVYETLPLLLVLFGGGWAIVRRWRPLSLFILGLCISIFSVRLGLHYYPFDYAWADKHLHMTAPWHLYTASMIAWSSLFLSTHFILRGERLRAFFVWWTLFGLLEYSYAGEKVPWIGVHITAPLILWAGYELGHLFKGIRSLSNRYLRLILSFALTAICLALFVRHAQMALEVSFERPTDPGEMLVYNHTMPEIKDVVEEINEIAEKSKQGKKLPMTVTGEVAWPMNWYLRHYARYLLPKPIATTDDFIILMNEDERSKTPRQFDEYSIRKVGLRQAWVPETWNLSAMWQSIIRPKADDAITTGGRRDWAEFWRYFWKREPWLNEGEKELSEPYSVLFLVRKDVK